MWGGLDSFSEPEAEGTQGSESPRPGFLWGGVYGGWFAGGKSYLRLAPALLGLKA